MKSSRSASITLLRWVPLVAAAVTCLAQAQQYKVVGPDGKTTYTDRPPASTGGKVSTVITSGGSSSEVSLPLELRQAASRYPVSLYVTIDDCAPCAAARQLLRQRGIPYAEKQVQSAEDNLALERLSGGREAPTLSIGAQVLRGLAPEVWNSYLDAAGYPRDSRLPANYQYPPATPMVARMPPSRPGNGAQPQAEPPPPVLTRPDTSGIRF